MSDAENRTGVGLQMRGLELAVGELEEAEPLAELLVGRLQGDHAPPEIVHRAEELLAEVQRWYAESA